MTDTKKMKAAAAPKVDKAVAWRDKYLQFVSTHPKTVSILLAVAVVWAVVTTVV